MFYGQYFVLTIVEMRVVANVKVILSRFGCSCPIGNLESRLLFSALGFLP